MWIRLARFILRYRIPILLVLAAFTGFMAYQATFVKMKYQYSGMLPEKDPRFQDYLKFKEIFGEDASVMILGIQDEHFFEKDFFNAWNQMSEEFRNLHGVNYVLSVSDAVDLVKNQDEKKFDIKKIFPKHIESQQELDSLRMVLENRPFYRQLLYNDTSHVYMMAITIDEKLMRTANRELMMDSLLNIAEKFSRSNSVQLHYSGLPYTKIRIGYMIKEEIKIFTIIALLVTSLLLFYLFRSYKVVFFSMLVVIVAVIWAFGTLGIMGYDITILTGMIPPLLIVIGIPNSVFLLNKYHTEFSSHGNQIKALHRVIHKVGQATFLTNLTTAVGFATFIITQNEMLVEFGIVASLNILGLFVLSILLIPIFFSFAKEPKHRHLKHLDKSSMNFMLDFVENVVKNSRRWVYFIVFVFLILSVFGIMRMKTTGYIVDDIPEDDPVYVDLKFFEKHFGGAMPFEIMVDTKKKKGGTRLPNLKAIDELQEKISALPDISNMYSIVDGLKFAKQGFYNGNPNRYSLPDNQELTFLYKYIGGASDSISLLNNLMDSSSQIVRVSGRVSDVGTIRMLGLLDSVHAIVNTVMDPEKYDVKVTGSSVIFTMGTTYLVNNLFSSVGLAVLLIAVFMAWMFRSRRMVLASLLPNLLPLLLTAMLMGFFGIPIKPSTVLVFSIAFGISVDNAIHFLAKYRQELVVRPDDIRKAVLHALRETGLSIIYTATILLFGFSIFMFSDFGGTQALGLLVTITLLVAVLSNLILLPSLILSINFFTTKNFKDSIIRMKDDIFSNNNNNIGDDDEI
jgi:predicted RND superfamily exporter protein